MNIKLELLMTWVPVLLGIVVQSIVSAEISVGVKVGDWVEYNVAYTGTPPIPPYATRVKFEILGVQGSSVTFNGTQTHSDGTQLTISETVNFDTGQLGDAFIIPANLDSGDIFFEQYAGNVTISGVEERTYAGAKRTVVYTTELPYAYWDKATGVIVEYRPDLYVTVKADRTNMWQAEFWLPIDSTLFYILIIAVAAIVVAVVLFAIGKRKKPAEEIRVLQLLHRLR